MTYSFGIERIRNKFKNGDKVIIRGIVFFSGAPGSRDPRPGRRNLASSVVEGGREKQGVEMLHSSLLKGWAGRGALTLALLVGAMMVFLMSGGLGEGQDRCNDDYCIEYPEHGSGAVVVFTALDPEGKDIMWGKTGTDGDAFNPIEEGRLTFMDPPDYEDPADNNDDNVYTLTIQATDVSAGFAADLRTENERPVTKTLKVTVTNVDEAGVVSLPTLQPQESVPISATLTDADGRPGADPLNTDLAEDLEDTNTKWQWSRSARATGSWTDIEDDPTTSANEGATAQTKAYTPTRADVGMYLRATATYDDGHGTGKTAEAISANPVQADPSNKAPEFQDEKGNKITSTTRSVAENSEAGTAVGAPVTATDPGIDGSQETLTYVLSGADSRDFDIDSGTGQIRVKAALDYEDVGGQTHQVTVRATDPSGGIANVNVTIAVTNVDEAPIITAGSASVDHKENASAGTEVASYTAEDPDGDDAASLKWSLSGRDAARFAIGNRDGEHGRLTFREAPDYEAPTNSDRDNIYEVTVEVTDRGGSKATRDVTVNVENVDEDGLLTVSNLYPQVGTRITPTLTDPDTPISNLIWTWEIDGTVESRANAYTPMPADENRSLKVSVTYTDGTGTRQTLSQPSISNVDGRGSGANQSPRFPTSASTSLTILENQPRGTVVGVPVTAGDDDDDDLTYSLSGGDSAFSIEQNSGRITTRAELDREKKSSYRVTVTAEDPSGERDTHSLTISVENVDEPPVITSGDVYIYYAENGRGNVAAYRAEDPEGSSIEWSLTGTDAEDFTFVRGVLKFKSSPDYEDKSEYTVIVNAGDGNANNADTEDITIAITNVDEEGEVTLSQEPQEETPLTAELMDPDSGVSSVAWQWASSSSRSGGFTDIQDANSASFTPKNDATGKYLRATVTYTDAQGGGKSAYVTSNNRTQWKESGAPKFKGADGITDITTTTREVSENAGAGTNVGVPVAATDIGNRGIPDTLTYGLGDAGDNLLFDIDPRTGQIKVKRGTTLDYEDSNNTDHEFAVTVEATDPSGESASISVTIKVVDVDETPELTLGATKFGVEATDTISSGFTHLEPVIADDSESGADTPSLSITFVGDDPEILNTVDDKTALTWTLAGTDADDFEIRDDPTTTGANEDGILRFKNGPDYEAPTDSGRNNVYEVTVQAADKAGNTASERVRITVENVGENGMVTLSHPQPEIGVSLTATLTDPDNVRSFSWQWYKGDLSAVTDVSNLPTESCPDAPSANCLIPRATSASYTPRVYSTDNTDIGRDLTAVASYTDGEGGKKFALKETDISVRPAPADNVVPEFQEDTGAKVLRGEREVREDAAAGAQVGDQVTATETSTDSATADTTFAYSLSSGDVRFFTIDQNGQISLAAGTVLDYETKKSYRVTVKAVDPSGASGTITVTINVINVDETPTLTRTGLVAVGSGSLSYPENGRHTVAEYSALGPNAGSVSWRLGGPDASDFSINSRGALTFRSTPNYEAPADADRDNRYELTVTARSGRDQDDIDVVVDVFNVEEDGKVTLSPTVGNIGTRITAGLTDPDGTLTGIVWEWARSESGTVGWTPIPGTNSDRYTIESEDRGYYLQVTAYYSDPEGGGKSASAVTTAVVRTDDDGVVTLTPTRTQIGTEVTARLTDPDGNIRNVTWQWARSDNRTSGWSDIPGATSTTYMTVTADLGSFLRASARYDDGDGLDKTADAVSTVAVVEDDDGVVTLSSTGPSIGDQVTATLSDPDGGVTGENWQWASSSNRTSDWTDIAGANSATYTVAAGDLGNFLRATVVYDDAAGAGKSAEAITTAAVTVDDDGSVTLSPSSPQLSDRVTAVLSDPDGGVTSLTWEWAISSNGTSNWTTVLGATSSTLDVTAAHVGSYLRATASYTDASGPNKSAVAVTAAAVSEDDDGRVTLSTSTPEVGTAVTATLVDPDSPLTNISWQWAKSSNGTTGWNIILGATSASYTPGRSDAGAFLRATVNYDDAVGTGKSAQAVTSAGVAQVALLSDYDRNGNGQIERSEAVTAVGDYFGGEISKQDVLDVLGLYFESR